MYGIISPCKDCEKRKLKCHGSCSDFKEFRSKIGVVKSKIKEDRFTQNVTVESVIRVKKRVYKE